MLTKGKSMLTKGKSIATVLMFLLGLSSIGLCNTTYTDFGYNKRFRDGQQKGSEILKSASSVTGEDDMVPYPQHKNPNTIKYDGFFLVTSSLYTFFQGTVYGGFTAYLGGHKTSKGFGILSSYGVGGSNIAGYETNIQIANISPSFSYKIGKSTILSSIGVTYVHASATDYDVTEVEVGNPTLSISYLYQPNNLFTLMVQGQLQSRGVVGYIFHEDPPHLPFQGRLHGGIMFSLGVGF